jgi:hypothetical protein
MEVSGSGAINTRPEVALGILASSWRWCCRTDVAGIGDDSRAQARARARDP